MSFEQFKIECEDMVGKNLERIEALEKIIEMQYSDPVNYKGEYKPTRFEKWQTEQMNKDYLLHKEWAVKEITELKEECLSFKPKKDAKKEYIASLNDPKAFEAVNLGILERTRVRDSGENADLPYYLPNGYVLMYKGKAHITKEVFEQEIKKNYQELISGFIKDLKEPHSREGLIETYKEMLNINE